MRFQQPFTMALSPSDGERAKNCVRVALFKAQRTPAKPSNPDKGVANFNAERMLALMMLLAATFQSFAEDHPPLLPPITSASGNPRLPGKFVWADLVTDDAIAARSFYIQLFGWRFQESGEYLIALNDERPLCGIFQRPRPKDGSAAPRWFGYISVPNVEKAQRAVIKGGGRVLAPPKKMPKRGEQALFADPEGALFGVVKSSSGDPEDFLAEPGDWIWIQLLSRDAPKAGEFYRSIAGYELVQNTSSNRVSDYVLTSKGYARATVRKIRDQSSQVKPTWILFVRVQNVADAVARTKEYGGRVLIEPRAELLNGKAALIADPTGAAIGLMEWSEGMKGGR